MHHTVVIGCGTIGLAFGVALASRGHKIALYDNAPGKRAAIADGMRFVREPEMARAGRAALDDGRISVLARLEMSAFPTNYIVCVPSPVNEAGAFDRSALDAVMAAIAEIAGPDDAVFIRSTLPIGTARGLAATMRDKGLALLFAATPDRSVEGRSFADQFTVPHLVGGVDCAAAERARSLLSSLGETIDLGKAEAAEAAKLFANAWRAATFAASNAMALACDAYDLDVQAIFAAASRDFPRFAPPRPGPFGGTCLPKDLALLEASVPQKARPFWQGVRAAETAFFQSIASRLDAHLEARPEPRRIVLAGIAFKGKPAVADCRGSVAVALGRHLCRQWPTADIIGWDAEMTDQQIEDAGFVAAHDLEIAARAADLLLFCNDHSALAEIDLERLSQASAAGALYFDLTGVTSPVRTNLSNTAMHCILGRNAATELAP